MSGLIDTTEMYLRTLIELAEEGKPPLRARIAERMEQSSPTVSQTVARMQRDGLLSLDDDRLIALSAEGKAQGVRVMRRHRLAERMLVDVLGLPLAQAHEEACRWEHVLGDEVERRIFELLNRPTTSPYGTPIPGLAGLGAAEAPGFLDGVRPLAEAGPGRLRVERLSENLQRQPDVLAATLDCGVIPGAVVERREAGEAYVVGADGAVAAVPHAAVPDIYVAV